MATTLLQSDLPGLNLIHRGKVRDVFDLGDGHLLMVATDRLSAFDVVLPDPIPGKGEMLCQISNFWFDKTAHIIANHLTGIDVASVLPAGVDPALYAKRAVVTKKLTPVPVECIARGYIIGSGWKDYQRTGEVSGIRLPAGLQQAQQYVLHVFAHIACFRKNSSIYYSKWNIKDFGYSPCHKGFTCPRLTYKQHI